MDQTRGRGRASLSADAFSPPPPAAEDEPDIVANVLMSSESDNQVQPTVHCPQCGYDLRALPQPRCPECGFRFDEEGIVGLNIAWGVEVLDDLRFAAAVQTVASAIATVYGIIWLRRGPGLPCADLCIAPFLMVLLLVLWSVNSIGLADFRRRLFDAAGRVAWILVAMFLLGFATRFEANFPAVWMLFPLPGLGLGWLALQKAWTGHELNRDDDPLIRRQLKPWIYGNVALAAISAVTAGVAGIKALF